METITITDHMDVAERISGAFELSDELSGGIIAVAQAHTQVEQDAYLQAIKAERHTGLKDKLGEAYVNEDTDAIKELEATAQYCALNGLYRRTISAQRQAAAPKKRKNHSRMKARRS